MNTIKHFLILCIFLFKLTALKSQVIFPEIDGWNKSDSITEYSEDNLWEYINGAAEYYLNYEFIKLEVVEYSFSENNYIKAEVYDHQCPLNAFGIYAYERTSSANYISTGFEGYSIHSALNFYGGKYYVKIHSNQSDTNTLNTIKKIACEIDKTNIIQVDNYSPTANFPTKNKVKYSDKFYPNNYLGHKFLNTVIEATYKFNNKQFKLFFIKTDNSNQAKEIVKSYLTFVKSKKKPKEGTIIEIDDPFNGLIYLSFRNNALYGVINLNNKEQATSYLKQLVK